MISEFRNKLFTPVDYIQVHIFRILFGLVLIIQFYSFWKVDYIDIGILQPKVLFKFDYTPFIKPFSEGVMKFILLLTLVAPVFIMINKFFRTAIVIYFFSFSYILLLEESYFNNHFYFILILTFLFMFYYPQKRINGNDKEKTIPYWLLFLFQLMVFIVYFYGGIAKLNTDWLLHQQPVRELLSINSKGSPFPGLTNSAFAVYYITYGGIVFDLLIGFFLFSRRTFKVAAIFTILFHLTNTWIFNFGEGGDIGIFPFLMIAANVLFADTEWLKKMSSKFSSAKPGVKKIKQQNVQQKVSIIYKKKIIYPFLIIFILVQLLLPFRHLLVPGSVDWTGQQQWFAWRMKIHVKKVKTVKFILRRFEGDQPIEVPLGQTINTMQINMMAQHADMVYKFVQYLKKDLKKRLNIDNAIINAEIKVSFNGRPEQYFIDPQENLFNMTYKPYGKNDWILPMKK